MVIETRRICCTALNMSHQRRRVRSQHLIECVAETFPIRWPLGTRQFGLDPNPDSDFQYLDVCGC
jgi:hypothetical protein